MQIYICIYIYISIYLCIYSSIYPYTYVHIVFCCVCEWVTSHIWMRHATITNEWWHTYGWVMCHIWMSHVIHMNESCYAYGWVTPPTLERVFLAFLAILIVASLPPKKVFCTHQFTHFLPTVVSTPWPLMYLRKYSNLCAWSLWCWHVIHTHVGGRLYFFFCLISTVIVTPTVHLGFVRIESLLCERGKRFSWAL